MRVLELASKAIHVNFGLTWGPGCDVVLSASVMIKNLYYYLDTLIAISEDFSWGSMSPEARSLLRLTRSY